MKYKTFLIRSIIAVGLFFIFDIMFMMISGRVITAHTWVAVVLTYLFMLHAFGSTGTKSLLYGAHCFLIHPFFVAAAWYRLYGFPYDLRLWVAFFVHDAGYLNKPNIDGPEGKQHPYLGAFLMGLLFGNKWYRFTLYHSRYMALKDKQRISQLCIADKLSLCLMPHWLYIPMAKFTGELQEYISLIPDHIKQAWETMPQSTERLWFDYVQKKNLLFVEDCKAGREYKPEQRFKSGGRVYQSLAIERNEMWEIEDTLPFYAGFDLGSKDGDSSSEAIFVKSSPGSETIASYIFPFSKSGRFFAAVKAAGGFDKFREALEQKENTADLCSLKEHREEGKKTNG